MNQPAAAYWIGESSIRKDFSFLWSKYVKLEKF